MTDERFNELLQGPLSHPLVPFAITRLALALRAVVMATGEAGDRALEAHCAARQDQDERNDEGDFGDDDSGLPPIFSEEGPE
jgi:hypothetical protein